jgi:hypothetical protein
MSELPVAGIWPEPGPTRSRGAGPLEARGRSPVEDPLTLVRIRLQQLIGGRPAEMFGLSVPLQVPGAGEPAAATVDRAAPLLPGLAGIVEAEQGVRLGLADGQARIQISTVSRPSRGQRTLIQTDCGAAGLPKQH